ncbi:MAG: DNA recombination protein RmuC [Woeseiaceae bacterium]|mgnify:FL=1|nr:DNA recombination protein RmuC [Woeseiaceae bacterium]
MILEPLSIQLISLIIVSALFGTIVAWLFFREKIKSLNTEIKHKDEILQERENTIKSATNPLREIFHEMANKSLQMNSENFLRLAEQNLSKQQERSNQELKKSEKAVENLVNPIKDILKDSQKQNAEMEKSRSKAYGGIESQLEEMKRNNKSLTDETSNLVNALSRPEIRGSWGEISLIKIVEISGMSEHCDFQTQVSKNTDNGVLRPDMIVKMPNKRHLIVDAKTPWQTFRDASESDNKEKTKILLKEHAKNVRKHINQLATKGYWDQFPQSPEFVILFIPVENFLIAALREDPGLMEHALKEKIILATPANFIALLKTVEYGWRQEAISENAHTIKNLAEVLHTRLITFFDHLKKMEGAISSGVENYNKAVGSLERNVLSQTRKFKELGITSKKEMTQLNAIEETPRKPYKPEE